MTNKKWYQPVLAVLGAIAAALAAALVVILRRRPKPPKPLRLKLYALPCAEVFKELEALGLVPDNKSQEDLFWQFPSGNGWDLLSPQLLVQGREYEPEFNDCDDFVTMAQGLASTRHNVKVIKVYGTAPNREGKPVGHAFGLLRRERGVYDILEPSTYAKVNVLKWWPQGPNDHGYEPQKYFR